MNSKQIKMSKYVILFFSICILISCKSKKQAIDTNISFTQEESFSYILDKSIEENKIVFMDFYTDWCLPCKMMEEDVFSDKEIAKFFNDNFINMKIDAEKKEGPDLSLMYQVRGFPTLIFVNSKGEEILRKEGMLYHTDLMNFANHALSLSQN